MNGVPRAQGDPELTKELDALVGSRSRRVAAAVIDAARDPSGRFAFVESNGATRFEIGSVTKGLTGMLLSDAVHRGEVDLDAELGLVFPDRAGTALGSITVRELCTHTSGLPRLPLTFLASPRTLSRLLLARNPYRGYTAGAVVNAAARQSLRRRGGRRRYSNLGAALLGQLLAHAAGVAFATLLRDRVFAPLGMNASMVASTGEHAPSGWSATGRRAEPWVMDGYAPAGGVVSTIDDMSRLAISLLDGSAPGVGALRPIAGVETDGPDRATGMFWVVDLLPATGRRLIWHNGQTGGYSAFVLLVPETEQAVVVLTSVASAAEAERIALGLLRRAS